MPRDAALQLLAELGQCHWLARFRVADPSYQLRVEDDRTGGRIVAVISKRV